MNKKNKFKYYFLLIITFGLIKLHWKKYRQTEVKNTLSVDENMNFKLSELIYALGGLKNIQDAESTQKKLKVAFKDKDAVDVKKLESLDGVSGIVLQSQSVSLVTGNNAKYIDQLIKKELDK